MTTEWAGLGRATQHWMILQEPGMSGTKAQSESVDD